MQMIAHQLHFPKVLENHSKINVLSPPRYGRFCAGVTPPATLTCAYD